MRKTCSNSALDPIQCRGQRSQIIYPIIEVGQNDTKGKKKTIALSNNGRKTISEWLRFLSSFCLHIIETSILLIYVNRSGAVPNVLSLQWVILSLLDTEFERRRSLPQDKTCYTYYSSVKICHQSIEEYKWLHCMDVIHPFHGRQPLKPHLGQQSESSDLR